MEIKPGECKFNEDSFLSPHWPLPDIVEIPIAISTVSSKKIVGRIAISFELMRGRKFTPIYTVVMGEDYFN
jgi:hypothetical protein